MINLARFDLPAAPSGWEGAGTDLVRIVDPRGEAIAWLAPHFGGACIGFAIRQEHPQSSGNSWLHALVSGTPDLVSSQPESFGCVPIGDATQGAWSLIQRDPTGAVLASSIQSQHGMLLTAKIDSGILRLSLAAKKADDRTIGLAVTIPTAVSDRLTIAGTGGVFVARSEHPDGTAITKRYVGRDGTVFLAIGQVETPSVEPDVR
ncbi:MAG: hypothetical protein ACR2OU_20865 [Thermomicrobiales bacterium]